MCGEAAWLGVLGPPPSPVWTHCGAGRRSRALDPARGSSRSQTRNDPPPLPTRPPCLAVSLGWSPHAHGQCTRTSRPAVSGQPPAGRPVHALGPPRSLLGTSVSAAPSQRPPRGSAHVARWEIRPRPALSPPLPLLARVPSWGKGALAGGTPEPEGTHPGLDEPSPSWTRRASRTRLPGPSLAAHVGVCALLQMRGPPPRTPSLHGRSRRARSRGPGRGRGGTFRGRCEPPAGGGVLPARRAALWPPGRLSSRRAGPPLVF